MLSSENLRVPTLTVLSILLGQLIFPVSSLARVEASTLLWVIHPS